MTPSAQLEAIEGQIARRLLGIIVAFISALLIAAIAWGTLSADVGRLKADVQEIHASTQLPLLRVQRTLDSLVIELRHLNDRSTP